MNRNELNGEIDLLIIKKIDGTINSEEDLVLNDYFDNNLKEKIKLEDYQLISQKASDIKIKQNRTPDQRWRHLELSINRKEKQKKSKALIIQSLSIAASILVFIVVYSYSNKELTLTAKKGEIVRHTLPDNSSVILNSESNLTYKESLFSNTRQVTIEGEVFFKVEKRRKSFVVNSDYAQIKVLGTQFNIRNRDSKVKISCLEGTVSVLNSNIPESSIVLKDAQTTHFDSKSKPVNPFSTNQSEINGWTEGIIVFDRTPILEVFNELMRTYNISITTNNIGIDITYNGEFRNQAINEILETITLSLDLKLIKIDENNYKIE
ncbi:MAG: DUF4974 domain-containing protein [Bacteroidales bacterium]|nr:MAG: DUF4974 domain-containing protein [Bacteroidales bacterium]